MPLEAPARIVRELTRHGYNADREAVTLIASAENPARTLQAVVESTPDDALTVTKERVRRVTEAGATESGDGTVSTPPDDPRFQLEMESRNRQMESGMLHLKRRG
ncbi:hypothetical protein ACFQH2_02065 [Natronoarchaeum sp. GCM10025703]|uniref:hypothetical protein n=1 Tax=Natronoarchaeum sp. GCM10025703 TaxID=3252685 RepID=UPI003620E8FA